jgi:hypothetical protein
MKKDKDIYIIEFEGEHREKIINLELLKIKLKWLLIYSTISIQFLPNNGNKNPV